MKKIYNFIFKIKTINKGFTLIELMVVIGIIAILSTLTAVYFETARMSARDARRLSDVKQIQLALKMYYNDLGYYPTAITAGNSIANGGTNYLLRIPSNPLPRADNGCPDQDYLYKSLDGSQRYSLAFCLGDKTDDLDAGQHTATANGILNCPVGYVAVPGSYTFQTNDFCVMKYEAKCADVNTPTVGLTDQATANNTWSNQGGFNEYPCDAGHSKVVTSLASGYPIANISLVDAMAYCQTIGGHLLTNLEWMTIARNAETVYSATAYNSNWESGAAGSGSMPQGISNGNLSGEATSEFHGGELPHGVHERRTIILSSGERIWDLAGSVSEWVSGTCTTDVGNNGGIGEYYNSGGYIDWNDNNLDDYERGAAGPSDDSWTNAGQGIGQYFGCDQDEKTFLRGGDAGESAPNPAGIYNLRLDKLDSGYNPLWGFRCVK